MATTLILAAGLIVASSEDAQLPNSSPIQQVERYVRASLASPALSEEVERPLKSIQRSAQWMARLLAQSDELPSDFADNVAALARRLQKIKVDRIRPPEVQVLHDIDSDFQNKVAYLSYGFASTQWARQEAAVSAIAADDEYVFTGGTDGSTTAWREETATKLWRHASQHPTQVLGGGPFGVMSGYDDGSIDKLSREHGNLLATHAMPDKLGFWDGSVAPDGELAAVASKNGTVWVCNFKDLKPHLEIRVTDQLQRRVVFALSKDGQRLATAGLDGRVTLRETEGGEWRSDVDQPNRPVTALTFVPSRNWLAAARRDGSITLHDGENGKTVRVLRDEQAPDGGWRSLTASPDGKLLVARGDRYLGLFRLDFEQKHVLFTPIPPLCVGFGKSSEVMYTGHADGSIQQWDTDAAMSSKRARTKVTVDTWYRGRKESGFEVFYVANALFDDEPRPYKRFDEFSTPTEQGIPPGNWWIWAGDPEKTESKRPLKIKDSAERRLDLTVPV